MADTQSVIKEVETKMTGALDALGREFAAVRTGRASAGLLDGIRVDYYGTPTEERRKQLAKSVHKIAEESRVVVRNLRREANDRLKAMAKDKKVSEDEERRSHDQIQKTTDRFIAKVDELLKKKEQEILSF